MEIEPYNNKVAKYMVIELLQGSISLFKLKLLYHAEFIVETYFMQNGDGTL